MERPVDRVVEDVECGFVSRERARQAYGVVIDEATMSVDESATDALRSELSPDLERLPDERRGLLLDLLGDLHTNAGKINRYGQQAEGIVRGMLAHAGADQGQREPVDLVELVERPGDVVRLLRRV